MLNDSLKRDHFEPLFLGSSNTDTKKLKITFRTGILVENNFVWNIFFYASNGSRVTDRLRKRASKVHIWETSGRGEAQVLFCRLSGWRKN